MIKQKLSLSSVKINYMYFKNMMRIRNLLAISYTILLLSCRGNKKKENTSEGIIIREYYLNGNIKSEGIYLNDIIKNGWYKKYRENGALEFKGQYLNGIKEGYFYSYTIGGKLESKAHYKNSLQDGKTIFYYKNSELKSESFWKQDKEIGELKLYYPNGKLAKYVVTDFEGNTRYLRKYNEKGSLVKEDGLILAQVYTSQPLDSIIVGEVITREIIAAQPPDTKTLVFTGEVNDKGKINKIEQCQFTENVFIYIEYQGYRIKNLAVYQDIRDSTLHLI
jgi:antitoxin component YwqK of YwqJK toxin-antitoxin module